jgi:hypothetical protein
MPTVVHNSRRVSPAKQLSPSPRTGMGEAELMTRTVAELRDLAREVGLTGYGRLRKADLVAELVGRV